MDCETVEDWAEFEYKQDENGNYVPIVEKLDNYETTWVIAWFTPEDGWTFETPEPDGQSADFIAYNKDRIPVDVVEAWEKV